MPGAPGMGLGKKAKGRQAPQPKKAKGKRQSPATRPSARSRRRVRPEKPAAAAGVPSASATEKGVPADFDPSQLRTSRSTSSSPLVHPGRQLRIHLRVLGELVGQAARHGRRRVPGRWDLLRVFLAVRRTSHVDTPVQASSSGDSAKTSQINRHQPLTM